MLKKRNKDKTNAKARLLKVAEELFAEKGFEGTSIREITSKAGTHLSAVSYHFGGKEGLYRAVFNIPFAERATKIRNAFVARISTGVNTSQEVIQALAESVIFGPMDDFERSIHFKLLARELSEPSDAFEIIKSKAIGPLAKAFKNSLKPFYPKLSEEKLIMAILSIFAQIIYFNFARAKVSALVGRPYDNLFKKELIDHITLFSLTGLEGLSADK